jgi:exonuclease I
MEIAILVIISIALFIYTLWPSFKVAEPLIVELDVRQRRRQLFEQEKRNNLKAIKDIDFELATGKISEEDHEELKTLYSLKAAEAIEAEKRLDDEPNDA